MKLKLKILLFFLIRKPWSKITLSILISFAPTQKLLSQEFQIGAAFNKQTRFNQAFYDAFQESGMNLMMQLSDDKTKPMIADNNLIAYNPDTRNDYIYHYSTSFYSKWEAEEDQKMWDKIGVKHKGGRESTYKKTKCWSTEGLKKSTRSLVYGPHYHQEKLYKRWYYEDKTFDRHNVQYITRYRMALDVSGKVNPDEDVCKLYVLVRHTPLVNGVAGNKVDHILKGPITLKVKDFQPYGTFNYFYLDNKTPWYTYPIEYHESEGGSGINSTSNTIWEDKYGDQGVQFCVDWLRNDSRCTLYIDNIEVYDKDGWSDYINPETRKSVIKNIQSYAKRFSDWPNLKYWGGCDEPSSIDAYLPIRIVDSLLRAYGAPPLMTVFYPQWNVFVNNDSQLVRYYNTAKPEKLIIDFYPFLTDFPVTRWDDWNTLQKQFQICHTLQPGFYYMAQAFGFQIKESGNWSIWRLPDAAEFKASVMLALAHGVKGIIFFQFDSYPMAGGIVLQGLIKNDPPKYTRTDLFYLIKDNLVPRLSGPLGKKLMELDYTGDYIQFYKIDGKQSSPSMNQISDNLLTVGIVSSQQDEQNWHCGLFSSPDHADDKYFFLTNLYTIANNRSIEMRITESGQDYKNYRLRNIEGNFDTTFKSQILKKITHTKGEGYLYQIAPVIKYGGRLLYSEETKDEMELTDDLIIDNGAVLTINGDYHSKANIIIKKGRVSYKNKGKIHFTSNKRLIKN
jgi:hypothetical protein